MTPGKLVLLHIGDLICSYCGYAHDADEDIAYGWIDEVWPTTGGGTLRITICPGCRRPWPS